MSIKSTFLLSFLFTILFCNIFSNNTLAQYNINKLKDNFQNPEIDYWPHTRWWWPGNPVSKEEITWELEQMHSHGIMGVEQITMSPVYEKGNIPYASEQYMEMAKHTVAEAKRLGMEVSFNFGGPGWIMGGDWVAEEDKSKDMVPTSVIVEGPGLYNGKLPDKLIKTKRSWEVYEPHLTGEEKLLAVVAGAIKNDTIVKESINILTNLVTDGNLKWQIPNGKWKIMAFWLKKNGHSNTVDHFNKGSMQRFCNFLGNRYKQYVGSEFGKTVDSFFGDSFELPNLASGIYWSNGLLEKFENQYGYDLVPYLPAIWWELGKMSPKIRYDVNEFLHKTGMETFFETLMDWFEENNLLGRIQTYGFTTDNIEAAGKTHIPEMEITAGEKDAMDWFDTRIGPKKYVASGAHIYGRKVISTEAYTFIHWERYRSTLEELKIASDIFLRSGATKFYNHGYSYSPERDVVPSRSMPWAAFIQPQNTWWKYYPNLAEYIARCSYMLRQGDFVADIAIYSPLANQWTKDVLNARKWTREFDWGELGNLILSNGYDFDLLNDDALQNLASIDKGNIRIRNIEYKILILPNVEAIPLKSLKFIEKYVKNGGTVIALERIPEFSTGFNAFKEKDKEIKKIVSSLFDTPRGRDAIAYHPYGKGQTYHIKQVLDRSIWWDKRSSTLDPFLNTIRKHIIPDFIIDFAHEGMRKNNGLAFQHRKINDIHIYFVTNIQEKESDIPITFRVKNKWIEKWNPYNGKISSIYLFEENEAGINIPVKLAPYESTFFVFKSGNPGNYVSKTNFYEILNVDETGLEAIADNNGSFNTILRNGESEKNISTKIEDIPSPFYITGEWSLRIKQGKTDNKKISLSHLVSWTKIEEIKHFSGTGTYDITFYLPGNYVSDDIQLILDVGKVGNIAEVIVNGQNIGSVWMRGIKPDITSSMREGRNNLTIHVTNTHINRVSAMTKPKPVPEELVERFGNAPTQTPERLPREFGFKPLPASGLLGPVKIIPLKKIKIEVK